MRTDVRIIAVLMVVLFIAALATVAAGMIMFALFPILGIAAICHHIDKNKAYYDSELDELFGKDDRLG